MRVININFKRCDLSLKLLFFSTINIWNFYILNKLFILFYILFNYYIYSVNMFSLSISISMKILNFFYDDCVYLPGKSDAVVQRERNGTLQKISRYFRVFTRGSRAGALKREACPRGHVIHTNIP